MTGALIGGRYVTAVFFKASMAWSFVLTAPNQKMLEIKMDLIV